MKIDQTHKWDILTKKLTRGERRNELLRQELCSFSLPEAQDIINYVRNNKGIKDVPNFFFSAQYGTVSLAEQRENTLELDGLSRYEFVDIMKYVRKNKGTLKGFFNMVLDSNEEYENDILTFLNNEFDDLGELNSVQVKLLVGMGRETATEFVRNAFEMGNTVKRALADIEAKMILAKHAKEDEDVLNMSPEEQGLIDGLIEDIKKLAIFSSKELRNLKNLQSLALVEAKIIELIRRQQTNPECYIPEYWKNRHCWTRLPWLKEALHNKPLRFQ